MTYGVFLVLYVVLTTTGVVLLRRSLADAEIPAVLMSPTFLLGLSAYLGSFLTFMLSLRSFEVLAVFPVFFGLAYTSVALAAVVVLDEDLSTGRLAGVVLVGSGVLLLARG